MIRYEWLFILLSVVCTVVALYRDARAAKLLSILIIVSLCGALPLGHAAAASAGAAANDACATLQSLQIAGVEIKDAKSQPSGPFSQSGGAPGMVRPAVDLPAHCRVAGVIERRIGVGDKPYGIQFEMRMPEAWNGRFLFQGGGGTNGVVRAAIGAVKGPPALTRGFAVVTQDGGHEGADSAFGEDQQARVDMMYRSYERVTTVAKRLVAAYYRKQPDKSYFMGCSEGGREALLASQRMPLEYDGVVAGDPGFLLGVKFQSEVDRLALAEVAPRLSDGKRDYTHAFATSDLTLLANTIIAACDAADGIQDGLIEHWSACKPNLARLACKAAKNDQCLSAAQLKAIKKIFEGQKPWTSGFPYDSGIAQPGWQDKLAGGGRLGGGGVSSVQGFFLTPYDPSYDDEKLDLARDGPRFEEVGALNRTDSVMYSSFRGHGGKLLMYTGVSDFAFSPRDLIAYYQRLAASNGGLDAAQTFARLFLVPGMTHCGGGQALDNFDPLNALVEWVENGKPPAQLLATGLAFPGRTRPLCPFPAEAHYKGAGSAEEASSFECRVPPAPVANGPARVNQ